MIRSTWKRLCQRSRVDVYRAILRYALDRGYLVTSLADWYEQGFYPGVKVLLCRHDVDIDTAGARRLFEVERQLGVRASYYFRWLTVDEGLMRELMGCGFEVSLHFETLATYAKARKIYSPADVTAEVLDECRALLHREMDEFDMRFCKIRTLCSHGDKRNRLLGISNQRILDGVDRSTLGIYFEAYDHDIASRFGEYISDSSVTTDHRWRYGISPQQAIDREVDTICLLTHPCHWNYTGASHLHRLWIYFREDAVAVKRGIDDIKRRRPPLD